jgi:radical SAM superfamily enzyme YgiQ (UPF0313 family)
MKNGKNIQRVLLLRLRPGVYDSNCHPIGFRPPYTLKYIESLLINQSVCSVKFVDQRVADLSLREIITIIEGWLPEIIVLSVSTLDVEKSLEFCRLIRASKSSKGVIIMGVGQEISSNMEKYRSSNALFDIALGGEAEQEAVSIIKRFNENASFNRNAPLNSQEKFTNDMIELNNLDELPFPIYDSESLKRYYFVYPLKVNRRLNWGHVLTSRGCPHNCIFCSHIMRETYGKGFRVRSAGNVVDEIKGLLKLGANIITFDDDNFTTSEEHVKAICEEIKLRGLKVQWIAHARVDEVTLPLLRTMKEAGCILLRFGIESGSEKIIKALSKTNNSCSWHNKAVEAVSAAKSLGITVACLFIVGSPGESKKDLLESIKFAKDLSPDIIQVAYFTPFPGSAAYQLFSQQIEKDGMPTMYHYKRPLANFSSMSDDEFKKAQNTFYKKFLIRPSFIIKHCSDCLFFYLNNLYIFGKYLRVLKQIVT